MIALSELCAAVKAEGVGCVLENDHHSAPMLVSTPVPGSIFDFYLISNCHNWHKSSFDL